MNAVNAEHGGSSDRTLTRRAQKATDEAYQAAANGGHPYPGQTNAQVWILKFWQSGELVHTSVHSTEKKARNTVTTWCMESFVTYHRAGSHGGTSEPNQHDRAPWVTDAYLETSTVDYWDVHEDPEFVLLMEVWRATKSGAAIRKHHFDLHDEDMWEIDAMLID